MIFGMFKQILLDLSVMLVVGGIAVAVLYFSGLMPTTGAGGLALGLGIGGLILFGLLIVRSGVIELPWHS